MDFASQTRECTDLIDPARVAAMHATLNLPGPAPAPGQPLPAFWHYIQFWDALPASLLGRDGHPRTGGFIPDLDLPRRMWAGGELQFLQPLLIGDHATRSSKIASVTEKNGSTGRLAIVKIQHEIIQNGAVCIVEEQSLIYRAETDISSPRPTTQQAPTTEKICQKRRFTTTDLFRYSALTFNGHRIHYDRDYAQRTEGYPGLVVHGPLLAQMLIGIAEGLIGPLNSFGFRATAPAFDGEEISFCALPGAVGVDLWVRGPDGRLCMKANAT